MADFISGVYNYCDRWCERCPFTAKCRVFAMEQEFKEQHSNKEDDWALQVSQNLSSALQMIYDYAAKEGIDLDNIKLEEAPRNLEIDALIERASLIVRQYEKLAENWLASKKAFLAKKLQEGQKIVTMGVKSMETHLNNIKNAVEVIRWYFFFIRAKVIRSYNCMHDKAIHKNQPIQNNMNGSAKIANIAVENSLAAWEILRSHFEEEADNILDIMVALSKIRKNLDAYFPNKNKFIRPGFDE